MILSSCWHLSQEISDVEDHLGMKECCYSNCFGSRKELVNWMAMQIQIHDSLINKIEKMSLSVVTRNTELWDQKLSNEMTTNLGSISSYRLKISQGSPMTSVLIYLSIHDKTFIIGCLYGFQTKTEKKIRLIIIMQRNTYYELIS